MENTKIRKTPEIIDRLKELQNKKHYSSTNVATMISIAPSTYKNIIRKSKGNTYIQFDIIQKLADLYECTTDYLICKSEEPHIDCMGHEITKAITFNDCNRMIFEITNYLQQNGEALRSLYFLTCQLPANYREKILTSINTLVDIMRMTSFLERADSLKPEKFSALENCLRFDDADYTNALICLSEADYQLSKNRRKSALKKYLEVVYLTITKSAQIAPLANQAIQQITALKKGWSNYPLELKPLADKLPELQYYHFINPDPSIKETIEKHFPELNKS